MEDNTTVLKGEIKAKLNSLRQDVDYADREKRRYYIYVLRDLVTESKEYSITKAYEYTAASGD